MPDALRADGTGKRLCETSDRSTVQKRNNRTIWSCVRKCFRDDKDVEGVTALQHTKKPKQEKKEHECMPNIDLGNKKESVLTDLPIKQEKCDILSGEQKSKTGKRKHHRPVKAKNPKCLTASENTFDRPFGSFIGMWSETLDAAQASIKRIHKEPIGILSNALHSNCAEPGKTAAVEPQQWFSSIFDCARLRK